MANLRGAFPKLVPGDKQLSSRKFNNAFDYLRDLEHVSSVNALVSAGVGGISISVPRQKRFVASSVIPRVGVARIMGLAETRPGFFGAFAGVIIPFVGADENSMPDNPEIVLIKAFWWPKSSDLQLVTPVIPFGLIGASDVAVQQVPTGPSRVEWYVVGLFTGSCL